MRLLESGKISDLAYESKKKKRNENILKLMPFAVRRQKSFILTAAIEHRPTKEDDAIMGPRLMSI